MKRAYSGENYSVRALLQKLSVMLLVLSLLLMYTGPIRGNFEVIKTETGFLGLSRSVYDRHGFDLYVALGEKEFLLDGDFIERPLGDIERELNRMVTYGAEVTYIEGPGLKPHLLGLKVMGDEYISFDEVYGEWKKNDRYMEIICIVCLVAGSLTGILARKKKDETGSE